MMSRVPMIWACLLSVFISFMVILCFCATLFNIHLKNGRGCASKMLFIFAGKWSKKQRFWKTDPTIYVPLHMLFPHGEVLRCVLIFYLFGLSISSSFHLQNQRHDLYQASVRLWIVLGIIWALSTILNRVPSIYFLTELSLCSSNPLRMLTE